MGMGYWGTRMYKTLVIGNWALSGHRVPQGRDILRLVPFGGTLHGEHGAHGETMGLGFVHLIETRCTKGKLIFPEFRYPF